MPGREEGAQDAVEDGDRENGEADVTRGTGGAIWGPWRWRMSRVVPKNV